MFKDQRRSSALRLIVSLLAKRAELGKDMTLKGKLKADLPEEFLERCEEAAQFSINERAAMSQEQLILLDQVAEEVRSIRMRLGENRNSFAKRVGIRATDLLLIEAAFCSPAKLVELLKKIDKAHGSEFASVVQAAGMSAHRSGSVQRGSHLSAREIRA